MDTYTLHVTRVFDNGSKQSFETMTFSTRAEMLAQIEVETRPVNQPNGQVSLRFHIDGDF